MKPSKYNFFIKHDPIGKYIAYNSRSNSLGLVDYESFEKIAQFSEDGTEIDDEKLVNDLRAGLFLIDDETDELELIRFAMYRDRFTTGALSLTIAPTSDCNFRCVYCYEKDVIKPIYMSEECIESIISMVESYAGIINLLSITWYGGEPLLGINTMKRLTERFLSICEENKVQYHANIVTNGFLLTKKNLLTLKDLKVETMQVTLDGMAEIHDKRRPLKGGKPTFDRIMANLEKNYKQLPNTVALRINVDKENITHANTLAKYLRDHELTGKVRAYLGKVCNDNECYEDDSLFNVEGFGGIHLAFEADKETPNIGAIYPAQTTAACGADRFNSFVIGADGAMYKCWSDIGYEKRSIGNILSGNVSRTRLYLDYLMFDPTQSPLCSECKLLPVCMGGCPFKRVQKSESCTIFKYKLNDFLSYIVNNVERLGIIPVTLTEAANI